MLPPPFSNPNLESVAVDRDLAGVAARLEALTPGAWEIDGLTISRAGREWHGPFLRLTFLASDHDGPIAPAAAFDLIPLGANRTEVQINAALLPVLPFLRRIVAKCGKSRPRLRPARPRGTVALDVARAP